MTSTVSECDFAPPLLDCQRHRFELPESICWLNSAYMSPLLRQVRSAGEAGLTLRAEPWRIVADDFFEPAERVRQLFARLICADADGIALAPSVSYGVALAAKNFPAQSGQNIVVVHEQFPSNIYPWRELAKERNLTIRTTTPVDVGWTQAILDNIDEQTAIVAIPHVHWTTGTQFDLERIAARTRTVKAALLIDATQSLGTLPFDVSVIQPDMLVAAGYKCLLGPYGLTYCYIAPRWRNGRPLEEGWLNRLNARDFARLTDYCDEYQPGARRFDFGERSSTILLPMAAAALEQILEWQTARIAEYSRLLIARIVEQADARGLWHPLLEVCSPCMVGISLPGSGPVDLGHRLSQKGVYVSIRKGNARIAPHVYNTVEDVDRFFATLDEIS